MKQPSVRPQPAARAVPRGDHADDTSALPSVLWLDEADPSALSLLGGKCASLAEFVQAGFGVPDAFAVTTHAFWGFMESSGLLELARSERGTLDLDDHAAVAAMSARMSAAFEAAALPGPLEHEVRTAYARLGDRAGTTESPVAVRSSGVAEDLGGASFAGQYDTFLWIMGADDVVRHVKRCWAGLFSTAVLTYRPAGTAPGGLDAVGIAVGVQRMVQPRAAGVMLTLDPVTGDRSKVVIESSWGLGEAVVSGEVTPDRFYIDKVTFEVVTREPARKESEYRFVPGQGVSLHPVPPERRDAVSVDDGDLRRLTELARRVERHRGSPQDIEWAIDEDGAVHVLQVRPETIWSQRPPASVVTAGVSGMDLVLRQMGARR